MTASCIQLRVSKLKKMAAEKAAEQGAPQSSPKPPLKRSRTTKTITASKKAKATPKIKKETMEDSENELSGVNQKNCGEPNTPPETPEGVYAVARGASREVTPTPSKASTSGLSKRSSPRSRNKIDYSQLNDPFADKNEVDGDGEPVFKNERDSSLDSMTSHDEDEYAQDDEDEKEVPLDTK